MVGEEREHTVIRLQRGTRAGHEHQLHLEERGLRYQMGECLADRAKFTRCREDYGQRRRARRLRRTLHRRMMEAARRGEQPPTGRVFAVTRLCLYVLRPLMSRSA